MADLGSPDYNHPWERYTYGDASLTETSYENIKELKKRIAQESLEYRIDSHKGFLRCEEPNCEFALKIRYGSSKGNIILGKSRFVHNHRTAKPKSFRKRKAELLESYYELNIAKKVKLKTMLEEIEKTLGEPLVGEDLKKFKNKIYNIRQKVRRIEDLQNSSYSGSPASSASPTPAPLPGVTEAAVAGAAVAAETAAQAAPAVVLRAKTPEIAPELTSSLLNEAQEPPAKKPRKREPLVKKINADEIKNIIYESQNSSKKHKNKAKKDTDTEPEINANFFEAVKQKELEKTPELVPVAALEVKSEDVIVNKPVEEPVKPFHENPIKLPMPKKRNFDAVDQESPLLHLLPTSSRYSQTTQSQQAQSLGLDSGSQRASSSRFSLLIRKFI